MNKAAIEQFLFGRYGAALAWPPHVRDAVREALTTTAASYNAGLQHAAKICADLEVTQDMCMGARRATLQACEERILACIEPAHDTELEQRWPNAVTEPAATQARGSEPCRDDLIIKENRSAPAAVSDSRVTLTREQVEDMTKRAMLRADLGSEGPVLSLGQQALAAIDLQAENSRLAKIAQHFIKRIPDLQAEVEQTRTQLYQEMQDHASSICALKSAASEEIKAANERAEAKPTITEEQIRQVILDKWFGPGTLIDHVTLVCREVLALVGAEVKETP